MGLYWVDVEMLVEAADIYDAREKALDEDWLEMSVTKVTEAEE